MKIVHVIDKLIGGGAETQLRHLTSNANSDFQHVIVYHKKGGAEFYEGKNVTLIFCDENRKFTLAKKVWQILDKEAPDIVQLWLPEYLCIPAAIYCKLNNLTIISCDRRAPIEKFGYMYFRDRLKIVQHMLADVVVTNFPFCKYGIVYRKILSIKKMDTIYNAITRSKIFLEDISLKEISKLRKPKINLNFVGRLVEQKRPEMIVEILEALIKNHPTYEFSATYYGVGDLKTQIIELATQKNIQKNVKMPGYVSSWTNEILESEYDIDLLVFPSINEGMPNVLFESASIRLPFVACDIDEIAIHFKNDLENLLVNSNLELRQQKIEFIKRILSLIEDDSYRHLVSEELIKNNMKYSIVSCVNRWEGIYQDLVGS